MSLLNGSLWSFLSKILKGVKLYSFLQWNSFPCYKHFPCVLKCQHPATITLRVRKEQNPWCGDAFWLFPQCSLGRFLCIGLGFPQLLTKLSELSLLFHSYLLTTAAVSLLIQLLFALAEVLLRQSDSEECWKGIFSILLWWRISVHFLVVIFKVAKSLQDTICVFYGIPRTHPNKLEGYDLR